MGRLTIIGSGELAPRMVRVHRAALEDHSNPRLAILDSPFGFQENADELTDKLVQFFRTSLTVEPTVVELRTAEDEARAARARSILDGADVVFSGPGSPTYALRIWTETGLADTLEKAIATRTVVFASAAACTLGRWAIPVYEIYKVGDEPFWNAGLDAFRLGGLPTLVVPHFDNKEGGTHDTSHCYIGEKRFTMMRHELPEHVVVGVDEHTAAAFDFSDRTVTVTGRGALHVIASDGHMVYTEGEHAVPEIEATALVERSSDGPLEAPHGSADIDSLLARVVAATGPGDAESAAVALANRAADGVVSETAIGPFVEILVAIRQQLRAEGNYQLADHIRSELADAGVVVNDTDAGAEWEMTNQRIERPSA